MRWQKPPPALRQVAVVGLSVILAKPRRRDAACTLCAARIRVDPYVNPALVVSQPEDVQQIRTVVQGGDIRSPQQPSAEVIALRLLS